MARKMAKAPAATDAPLATVKVAEPPVTLDNNKRLRYLEAQVDKLQAVLGDRVTDGGDVIDTAIQVIGNQADAIAPLIADGERTSPGELAAIKRAEEAEAKIAELKKQVAGLTTLVEEANAHNATLEATVSSAVPVSPVDREAYEEAVCREVPTFSALPDDEPIRLRFSDGRAFVGPAIDVKPSEMEAAGGRALLMRPVDFGPEIDPAEIEAAWLIAGDKACRCELPSRFRIGGGAGGRFPAGHLIF